MFRYFYHINEAKRESCDRLFYHRWFWDFKRFKGFSLDVWSGKALRCEFTRGEASDDQNSCDLTLGLIFFTVCFKFPCHDRFLEKKKCIATWDNNKEFELVQGRCYGFYLHDWAFVWSWHAKIHESSSSDPWWMRQYINLDELVLGKPLTLSTPRDQTRDVYFRLGDKEFKIDKIELKKVQRFRSFIPLALWHETGFRLEVTIDKPPMRSGRGENDWDCGDDGTFGLSCRWDGPEPTFENREECFQLTVDEYVKDVLKDANRYGGSSGERGIKASDQYEYIGRKK